MIVEITKLERGTIESKQGKTLTGLAVEGIKIDEDGNAGEEYEKFLMDWKNPDEIEVIEGAGVGSTVEIRNEKDGRFWNVTGAEVVEPGDGQDSVTTQKEKTPSQKENTDYHKHPRPVSNTESQRPSKAAQEATQASQAVQAASVLPNGHTIRLEALDQAVKLTDSILSSDERFKKLVPAGKVTGEIVMQTTLENASKFELFIKGDLKPEVKSDASDLTSEPVDAAEPELPGEEA
jgi:hypothetical protein